MKATFLATTIPRVHPITSGRLRWDPHLWTRAKATYSATRAFPASRGLALSHALILTVFLVAAATFAFRLEIGRTPPHFCYRRKFFARSWETSRAGSIR